jgi:hypothetical protein
MYKINKVNMMKRTLLLAAVVAMAAFSSCKKCHECHYDGADGKKIDLGEHCGKDLENLEKNGTTVDGKTVEVHCHDH